MRKSLMAAAVFVVVGLSLMISSPASAAGGPPEIQTFTIQAEGCTDGIHAVAQSLSITLVAEHALQNAPYMLSVVGPDEVHATLDAKANQESHLAIQGSVSAGNGVGFVPGRKYAVMLDTQTDPTDALSAHFVLSADCNQVTVTALVVPWKQTPPAWLDFIRASAYVVIGLGLGLAGCGFYYVFHLRPKLSQSV